MARPKEFLDWATEIFGPLARDSEERLARFIEEAIELAHADMMPRDLLERIVERVFSREQGNVRKEIGQAQACLEMYAQSIGLSADAEAAREFERVKCIPKSEWARRHAAKAAIGITHG